MADTLQISVSFTGAESVIIPVTQPSTSAATLPNLTNPLVSFAQTFLPATGLFSTTRLTFTPSVSSFTVTPVGTHAMLLVDDPAFASNTSIQLDVTDAGSTILYGSVNGGNAVSTYTAAPTPWPAIFRAPAGAVLIRTESVPGVAYAPTVAFSATLYTW
jgi:hypothetical protein